MRLPSRLRVLLLAGLAALAWTAAAQAPPKTKPGTTTIYLVRHAEKDTANPADPALSAAGLVRAQALRQTLARRQPVALFTTDTKRTRITLAPLAAALKLQPLVYNPQRGRDFAVHIAWDYAGQTVVIVGHSNTLLDLIKNFGATPPINEIGDNEYDYLFTVRIASGQQSTVAVSTYGAPSPRPATKTDPSTSATPAK